MLSPGQKSNSFLFHAFYVFVVRFFPALANLAIILYLSRFISKPLYGVYQNFWIQLNFLGPLLCIGMHSLVFTYSPGVLAGLLRQLRLAHLVRYGFWALLVAAVFALLQYVANGGAFALTAAGIIIIFAANTVVEALLVSFRSYVPLAIINLLYSAGYLAIHYCFVKQGFTLQVLFSLILLVGMARLIAFLSVCGITLSSVRTQVLPPAYSMADVRKLWFHLGLNDVLQAFSTWVDKFLVSVALTATVSAIYFNGTQNIPFLSLMLSAAGSSVLLQLHDTGNNNTPVLLMQAMKQSARYSAAIVMPLMFFLVFYGAHLFALFLPAYTQSVPVFVVSLLVLPIRAYSFSTVFQKLHKGHLANYGALLELAIACLLMYPMYRSLGLPGIALCFVISTYAQVGYYLYHMQRLFGMPWYRILPLGNWLFKGLVSVAVIGCTYWAIAGTATAAILLAAGLSILIIIVAGFLAWEHKNAVKYGRK